MVGRYLPPPYLGWIDATKCGLAEDLAIVILIGDQIKDEVLASALHGLNTLGTSSAVIKYDHEVGMATVPPP